MARRWFFPAWNGDVRIERVPGSEDQRAQIVVHDPTEAELKALRMLVPSLREKGFLDPAAGLWAPGGSSKQTTQLDATIADVAPLLMKALRKNAPTLHAVKHSDGSYTTADNTDPEAVDAVVEAASADREAEGVTVERPTPCCPDTIPGPINPAKEVLLAFLTEAEKERWEREHTLVVTGGRTGYKYLVAHRHRAHELGMQKICFDLTHRHILHFHDWSVPPEEEVLAAKLILEHREPWLRNEATCFGSSCFKNPFGDGGDGTWDASLMHKLGGGLRRVIAGFGPGSE